MTADELLARALAAADDARRRQRERFDARWGCFAKCDRCGSARRPALQAIGQRHRAKSCAGGAFKLAGYSTPWRP